MIKPIIPQGCYSGAWICPRTNDWSTAAHMALWRGREADAQRTIDIAHNFYPFTTTFPSWREPWHIANNRIPMVSWNGGQSSEILAGQHDVMIRTRAQALRNLKVPIFLRYFWEMDGSKKTIAESPKAFIAAWLRIYYIFVSEGADNVAFVWCPNAWAWDMGTATQYYPGDQYVDWIAADGYNWYPKKGGARSFFDIYKTFYQWAVVKDKPLMVGEYGALETSDYNGKAHWLFDARMTMRLQMPRIKAAVYFDENKSEQQDVFDWRVDTSVPGYTAYLDMVRDRHFGA